MTILVFCPDFFLASILLFICLLYILHQYSTPISQLQNLLTFCTISWILSLYTNFLCYSFSYPNSSSYLFTFIKKRFTSLWAAFQTSSLRRGSPLEGCCHTQVSHCHKTMALINFIPLHWSSFKQDITSI